MYVENMCQIVFKSGFCGHFTKEILQLFKNYQNYKNVFFFKLKGSGVATFWAKAKFKFSPIEHYNPCKTIIINNLNIFHQVYLTGSFQN
jgi:hypothetical protein